MSYHDEANRIADEEYLRQLAVERFAERLAKHITDTVNLITEKEMEQNETVGEIKKTYAYHKPSETGLRKIAKLRQLFSMVHDQIEELVPQSREKSVAFTNLETAAMWAIKAVVCNDPESEVAV